MKDVYAIELVQPFFLVMEARNRAGFVRQVRSLAAQVHNVFNTAALDRRNDALADLFLIGPEVRN